MRLGFWLVPLGAALGMGCRSEPSRGVSSPADSALARAIDPATAPGQVALSLWQLREGVTLAEWITTRGLEDIQFYSRDAGRDYLGEWCARATVLIPSGVGPIQRVAYFYPPAPPSRGQLPSDLASADSVRASCVLGLLATQIGIADSAAGRRVTDSVAAVLTRVFGQGERDPQVSFYASAFWRRTTLWRHNDAVIVSTLSGLPYAAEETAARWSTLAFAFLPHTGLSVDPEREPVDAAQPVMDTVPLEQAARLSGVDTTAWSSLRRVLAAAEPAPSTAGDAVPVTPPADSLVRALGRWLTAARRLPPQQRAAALFVADAVLDRSLCAYGMCTGKEGAHLAPLRTMGARFAWSDAAGGWVYRRNWMFEARTLDRDSRIGQSVFLQQLALGFDPSGICESGGEGFQRVLDNGERYLARVPASPIVPEVRLMLGDAYDDIVAIADGAVEELPNTAQYAARAPIARREALRHYRAAIDAAAGTPVAEAAWRKGWWLLSALPLRSARFHCLND